MVNNRTVVVTLEKYPKGFSLWVERDNVAVFSKHGYLKAYDQMQILRRTFKALELRVKFFDDTGNEQPEWWRWLELEATAPKGEFDTRRLR